VGYWVGSKFDFSYRKNCSIELKFLPYAAYGAWLTENLSSGKQTDFDVIKNELIFRTYSK